MAEWGRPIIGLCPSPAGQDWRTLHAPQQGLLTSSCTINFVEETEDRWETTAGIVEEGAGAPVPLQCWRRRCFHGQHEALKMDTESRCDQYVNIHTQKVSQGPLTVTD